MITEAYSDDRDENRPISAIKNSKDVSPVFHLTDEIYRQLNRIQDAITAVEESVKPATVQVEVAVPPEEVINEDVSDLESSLHGMCTQLQTIKARLIKINSSIRL